MYLYKRILLRFIILVLLTATVLISSGCMNEQAKGPPVKLSEYIESSMNEQANDPSAELSECIESIRYGKVDELNLTIYYMDPNVLTREPVCEKDLIEKWYEYKITISGKKLREHIDLLDQLANAALTPVAEQGSDGFARLYYVFESKENDKIFSVYMWNGNGGIFVNGLEVEANDVFYDVVMPFLPEEAAEKIEIYLERDSNQ